MILGYLALNYFIPIRTSYLMTSSFSRNLLKWHQTIDRDMPWKESKNVFHIWLSEIILQQTRVEQGKPYFLKFRDRFKGVEELAEVSDEELMKLWQGLGYYSRARNLHKAAKIIAAEGQFPETYEGWLALPGIGPYSAAAITSFAYDLPIPVIDGNVNRVISRLFGIVDGIDTREGREQIRAKLESVFDNIQPAAFNQAIMDFGALQCIPKSPNCDVCPFLMECVAYEKDLVSMIPLKTKKVVKRSRTLNYALIFFGNQLLIKKRKGNDIWKHLHDFPTLDELDRILSYEAADPIKADGPYKHILTHLNLKVFFHKIEANDLNLKNGVGYFLVERENLRKFAFPKIIDWYLANKAIY